jgi:arginyl-tRNA synthetase
MSVPSLANRADALLAAAFAAASLDPAYARSAACARPDLADFQCTGAMAAARAAGGDPRRAAAAVAAALAGLPGVAAATVFGPGIVNFSVDDDLLRDALAAQIADPALGVQAAPGAAAAVVDFGGPNVAKPLHVGHLRSLVIGESLRRILAARGWAVTSDAHLGDWGLQMGMLIDAIRLRDPAAAWFGDGPWPTAAPVTAAELEGLYPAAAAACKADAGRMEAARRATAELQAGRPGHVALWRALRAVSLEVQKRDFDRLGAHFDLMGGESDAAPSIGPMLAELRRRGLAVEDQGAAVIRVAAEGDEHPVPPLIVEKADGAALYATTDLATLRDRVSGGARRVLYVVDQRQALHFQQVFRAAALAGWGDGCEFTHVGFGTVNGPDGKPFKTRDGGVAKLSDLLDAATEKADARLRDGGWADGGERLALAAMVGVAAVKYADLCGARTGGYVFDPERIVSFEGRTGPYLQYACVRMSSILEKAAAGAGLAPAAPLGAAERALALACLRLPEAVAAADAACAPSEVAAWAWSAAQAFSRFYAECPVLGGGDGEARSRRLALVAVAKAALSRGLWLLGIDVPDRM